MLAGCCTNILKQLMGNVDILLKHTDLEKWLGRVFFFFLYQLKWQVYMYYKTVVTKAIPYSFQISSHSNTNKISVFDNMGK